MPKNTAIGLAFTAEQVLCCIIRQEDDVIVWETDLSFSHHSWQKSLKEMVKQRGLQGACCYFALTAHWYKMHTIDRPDVADDEVFTAIKWPLHELSGQATNLVYDYADLPANVGGQRKVLVVALARQEVEKLSHAIYKAELNLSAVSVEEFTVTALMPIRKEAIISLVQEHGEEVVLNIVKDGKIYFSRRLKGYENIGTFSESELDMGIVDSLCVQIQRSMDYFESQLRQAPVQGIVIKLDSQHAEYLSAKISSAMGVPCELFIPDLICADGLNFKMASFSCLGAAYSHFVLAAQQNTSIKHAADNKDEIEHEAAH
ncbi:biogenesis protein MshI [Agaribacter flavus]|uniref:Biogenesis protein MshI n=1 Tax=Agaribacter flavus TaxID=1902781 RepID=A0ABV7FRU7_9ALTE